MEGGTCRRNETTRFESVAGGRFALLQRPRKLEMVLPVVWPGSAFFYPIGNTSAVDLTDTLTPEENAHVLLLGCGDPRHILFTVHNQRLNSENIQDVLLWSRILMGHRLKVDVRSILPAAMSNQLSWVCPCQLPPPKLGD